MHGLFIKLLGKPARPPLQCQRASPPRYPLPPAAAARHAGQLASQHRGTAVAAAVNRTGHEGCHRSHPQFGRHSAQQAVYQKHKTLAPNVRAWPTISLGPTYCCHDLPPSSFADTGSLVTTALDAVIINCHKALLAVLGPKLQIKRTGATGVRWTEQRRTSHKTPEVFQPHINLLPDVPVVSLTVGHVLSVHLKVGSVQASAKATWAQRKRPGRLQCHFPLRMMMFITISARD